MWFLSGTEFKNCGDVAQWQRVCFACRRSGVQSPSSPYSVNFRMVTCSTHVGCFLCTYSSVAERSIAVIFWTFGSKPPNVYSLCTTQNHKFGSQYFWKNINTWCVHFNIGILYSCTAHKHTQFTSVPMTMMTQVTRQNCNCNCTETNYYSTVQCILHTCINSQHHPQLNSNININDINMMIYTRQTYSWHRDQSSSCDKKRRSDTRIRLLVLNPQLLERSIIQSMWPPNPTTS